MKRKSRMRRIKADRNGVGGLLGREKGGDTNRKVRNVEWLVSSKL